MIKPINSAFLLLLSILSYRIFLFTTIFLASLISLVIVAEDSYGQSEYSPFYVNETAEAEKNRIEYETYSSPEYGFSIDYLKGATIEDYLDVERAAQLYVGVEGPEIQFEGGGPPHSGVRFSSFNIYLNDSINMDRYIQRDLEADPVMPSEYQTKVLDSGSPITVDGLSGKSIKFIPMGLGIIKEAAYFNDGVNTYHIEYTDEELSFRDEVFDHIVNSFKFIPIIKDMPEVDNSEQVANDNNNDDDNNDDDNDDSDNEDENN